MKTASDIIRGLHVTEKGAELAEKDNKYFFKVAPTARKAEIKRAVEDVFDVKVRSVNTMRYEGKKKRERTVRYGKRSDWKKAVVTLAEGSKIDLTA